MQKYYKLTAMAFLACVLGNCLQAAEVPQNPVLKCIELEVSHIQTQLSDMERYEYSQGVCIEFSYYKPGNMSVVYFKRKDYKLVYCCLQESLDEIVKNPLNLNKLLDLGAVVVVLNASHENRAMLWHQLNYTQ